MHDRISEEKGTQPKTEHPVMKRKLSTVQARRRARVYCASVKKVGLNVPNTSRVDLGGSRGSNLSCSQASFVSSDIDSRTKRDLYMQGVVANSQWITKTFRRKECIRYVENANKPGECCCGRLKNQHGQLTIVEEEQEEEEEECDDDYQQRNEATSKDMAPGLPPIVSSRPQSSLSPKGRHPKSWNAREDVKEVPTNAFGEIKFTNAYGSNRLKPAKYIRIADNTKVESILELLVRQWRLKRPDIVISVHGGLKNFKLDPQHKETFNRGLIKAAKTTSSGAWVLTGGTNLGVMKAVGQAVQEGQSMQWGGLNSHRALRCIGITTWGYVDNNENLTSGTEGKGCYPATYRVEHFFKRGQPVSLNPDHTHFILVDDGTQGQCGQKEVQLRARLEKAIAEKPSVNKQKHGLGVPVCLMVLEGGQDALKAVWEATKHKMPAVVVEGTGRTADILGFAYHNCQEVDGKRQVMEEKLPRLVMKIKESYPKLLNAGSGELQEYVEIINDCIADEKLITVYNINEKQNMDMDLAILSALLKGQGASKFDQLKLALTWNRVDVAEKKIFTSDTDWPSGSLDEMMMNALVMGRVDFVRLFLSSGVSMRDFLTVSSLRKLYNSAPEGSHFYSLVATVADTPDGPFSLKDLGKLIKELVGAHYEPLYSVDSPHTHTLAAHAISMLGAVPHGIQDEDRVNFLPARGGNSHVGKTRLVNSPQHFEKPFRELFLWAVLMNRFEMARFMWERSEEAVADSLVAARLFLAMHDRVDEEFFEIKEEFKENAVEFENLAIGVIDECDNEDEVLAEMLVEREFPNWGGMSCLNLAAAAKAEKFLAHPCCQTCLNNIWKSRGMPGAENIQVIFALVFPLLVLWMQFYDDSTNSWKVPFWKKLKILYTAPIAKFWTHLGSHFVFLCLYAFVILFSFERTYPSVYEAIIMCWLFTIICEEIRQVLLQESSTLRSKIALYFSSTVNITDTLANSIAVVAFVLRFFGPTWEAARVLYCLNFIVFCFRLFRVYFVSGYLGPKLVMIKRMLKDVVMWLCLLIVFVISYGVFRQALFFGSSRSPYINVIHEIFFKPYWHVYGELFMDQSTEDGKLATGEKPVHYAVHLIWINRVLMVCYFLITNILLLNLLIAIFSNVFTEVETNAYKIWKYQYYYLVMEYDNVSVIAPPLVIISHVVELFDWMSRKCCRTNRVTPKFTVEDLEMLRLFEVECAANYRGKEEEKQSSSTEQRIKKTTDRVESMSKQIGELHDLIEKHLDRQSERTCKTSRQ